MSAEAEHTGARVESSSSDTPYRHAIEDSIGKPVNWVLLVGLLGCLSLWGAVVFGIVAAT